MSGRPGGTTGQRDNGEASKTALQTGESVSRPGYVNVTMETNDGKTLKISEETKSSHITPDNQKEQQKKSLAELIKASGVKFAPINENKSIAGLNLERSVSSGVPGKPAGGRSVFTFDSLPSFKGGMRTRHARRRDEDYENLGVNRTQSMFEDRSLPEAWGVPRTRAKSDQSSTGYENVDPQCSTAGSFNQPNEPPLFENDSQGQRETGVKPDQVEGDVTDSNEDSYSSDDSYFEDSDFDDTDSDETDSGSKKPLSERDLNQQKAKEIIQELLRSEKAYVEKLHLLVRVLLMNIQVLNNVYESPFVPPEVVKQIFSNLEVIYNFHAFNLFPQIQDRYQIWSERPRLGDVMKNMMPFLRLYHVYLEDYNKSVGTLKDWCKKSPVLANLVAQVEKTPECRRLTIAQHMLNVCHRAAHYQAILRDYMTCLEDTAEDMEDTTDALAEVTAITDKLQKAMSKDDRVQKLQEIQKKMEGSVNIVNSTREYVHDGRLLLISPKSGKTKEQHLFVFNDLLLLCHNASISGKHKLQAEIRVADVQVTEGQNLDVPFTFHIHTMKKSMECKARNKEEMNAWLECLNKVLADYRKWRLAGLPQSQTTNQQVEWELGCRAPTLVHASAVSMCMACGVTFGGLQKKKHCMACGKIVCKKCSSSKVRLQYDTTRLNKVCDECYLSLRMKDVQNTKNKWNTLNVRATDPCVCSDYMQVSSDSGKTWNRRWLSLRDDGSLYSFKAHQDIAAVSFMYLPDCTINNLDDDVKDGSEGPFSIRHGKKQYTFKLEHSADKQKWRSAMAQVSTTKMASRVLTPD